MACGPHLQEEGYDIFAPKESAEIGFNAMGLCLRKPHWDL